MTNIKVETARLLKNNFQIEESVTAQLFEEGILHEPDVKKVLIRNEYRRRKCPGEKQRLKGKLAEKFCVSIDLIEKIVKNS